MANVKITVETLEKGSANVKQAESNLKNLFTAVAGGVATITAFGVAAKKVFDLSEEGANLNQLEQSFNFLNDTVLKTPNLLNDMRDASRGTIADTVLMEGVLKLTAGTTDEMAQAFAAASPHLLEIAKAAQKLNPTLGDTAFLYESVTTGIKRQSPLILDNLGIVVKVGEANEKYAESLGKSVEELTANEKQQALLNATLEAGDRLISQVGGNVDSQADAWAQLTAEIKNATDAQKEAAAEGLVPVVKELGASLKATDLSNQMIEQGIITWDEWGEIQKKTFFSLQANQERVELLMKAQEEHNRILAEEAAATLAAADATESFDRAMSGGASAVEQFNDILSETEKQYRMNTLVANDYREASLDYEVTADDVKAAEERRKDATQEMAKALEEAAKAADAARQAQADFFNSLVGDSDALKEWNDIMGESSTVTYKVSGRTMEQQGALEDLQDAYKRAQETITSYQIGVKGVGLSEEERNEKIQEQIDYMGQLQAQMDPLLAIQNEYATTTQEGTVNTDLLNQKLFEQIQASDADATSIAIAGVALGQFTEEQADAMLKAALLEEFIRGQAQAFGEGKTSIEDAQLAIQNFIAELNNIPSLVQTEVRTNWTQTGNPPPVTGGAGPGGNAPGSTPQYQAAGGDVVAGNRYIVGERGPEMFVPATNGRIVSNRDMGKQGGGNTVNVYVMGGMASSPQAIAGAVSKALTPRG